MSLCAVYVKIFTYDAHSIVVQIVNRL